MSKFKECHKCPFNGKQSTECLHCMQSEETYRTFNYYISDKFTAQQESTEGSDKVTYLSEDDEDTLRKFLYTLFDLSPNEILCIKAIMNGQSMVEFAKDMEELSKRNQTFTRFRAFQTRKLLMNKLGKEKFSKVLITKGQRKKLKG